MKLGFLPSGGDDWESDRAHLLLRFQKLQKYTDYIWDTLQSYQNVTQVQAGKVMRRRSMEPPKLCLFFSSPKVNLGYTLCRSMPGKMGEKASRLKEKLLSQGFTVFFIFSQKSSPWNNLPDSFEYLFHDLQNPN